MDDLKDLIKKYFSLDDYAEKDQFQKGFEDSIHAYFQSEKICQNTVLEDLFCLFEDSSLPDNPVPMSSYLQFLSKNLTPNLVNVTKPTYIGHMTSALPNFLPAISEFVTATNQNNVKIETSNAATLLERQVLAMMHKLVFDLPEPFYQNNIQNQKVNLGLIVSGGTLANISSMWIARNKTLKETPTFRGIQKEGLWKAMAHYGYNEAVIIGSTLMHYSMEKMASILGFGVENIIKIRVNPKGGIDIHETEKVIEYCIENKKLIISLVGIAGTTETGQIDDLQALAKLAHKYKIHFHVDAAWGGPILFSDKHKHLLKGIESADTVIICGHKQLYLPQGISMVLCKDPEQLNFINFNTKYQARKDSFDLGKHSPEGSRPSFSIYLHACLNLLGKKGYEYLINEGISKAKFLAELIKSSEEFELIEEPHMNIVIYRYIPPEQRKKLLNEEDQYIINCVNEVLQDEQFKRGKTFISRSTISHNKYENTDLVILRAVLTNPMVREEDIRAVLNDQKEIGSEILSTRQFAFSELVKLLYVQTTSYNRQ